MKHVNPTSTRCDCNETHTQCRVFLCMKLFLYQRCETIFCQRILALYPSACSSLSCVMCHAWPCVYRGRSMVKRSYVGISSCLKNILTLCREVVLFFDCDKQQIKVQLLFLFLFCWWSKGSVGHAELVHELIGEDCCFIIYYSGKP